LRTHNTHDRVPRVQDVVDALDALTRGRLSEPRHAENPWHVTKSSGLRGKAVTESPGLVMGEPDAPVRRLAVAMTMTEHHIELAHAAGINAIVAHHPVADAASAGGVALADYLPRYNLAVLECHEAFHGLHPGIAFMHGHEPFHHDGAFGGVHGKIVMVGRPLAGVRTLGDVLARLRLWLERDRDDEVLRAERAVRGCDTLIDSATTPGLRILVGSQDTPIGRTVIHVFPHTGFSGQDLAALLREYPDAGTVILSISGASNEDELVRTAADHRLGVIVGSSHASEILENGLPLAYALDELLPGVEVTLFRDRVVNLPLGAAAPGHLGEYSRQMGGYLVNHATTVSRPIPSAGSPSASRAGSSTTTIGAATTGGRP
jgi:hypothetical protein